MTLQEEEEVVESNEAILSSLTVLLDTKGNIIIEQKGVPADILKKTLREAYPSWDGLQAVLDTAIWVDESINDLSKHIMEEYGSNEGIHIQERHV